MRLFPAAILVAFALSACQDPAGVGLGLIDEEQLDPNVRIISLDGLTTFDDSTVAVGIALASNNLAQPRVLAGSVVDATFGDARAVAYVDFLQPDAALDAQPGVVTEAWLEMRRTYTYGDTTAALPLELRPIQGSWDADRDFPPDSLFDVGEILSLTEVAQADTLKRFDLPAQWVTDNAAVLVGTDFGTGFEGFALQTPADYMPMPGVVFGFDTFSDRLSGMRVVANDDTLFYPLSEVYSSVATADPAPSAILLPSRSNSQSAITFTADLLDVGATALARARLRLPIDASVAQEGTFVRPVATQSFLFGIQGEGDDRERVFLGTVIYDEDTGELSITDTVTLTTTFQAVLIDPDEGFDSYEVVPNPATAALDVLPVLLPGMSTGPAPRFTLTLVGASN